MAPPRRGLKRPREAGIRAKPQRKHRFARNHSESVKTKAPSTPPRARARVRARAPAFAVGNLSGPPRRGLKRPREARIRAKPQREHRNATEFARNHSGSIETQRNSRETTAGASKPRPPQKRPEEATRGRNSRETTAGASKCNGIRAKPQREHRNATEFARITTTGASKPRPRPTAARAVAVSNQFLYPERKNPIVQALFGEQKNSSGKKGRLWEGKGCRLKKEEKKVAR